MDSVNPVPLLSVSNILSLSFFHMIEVNCRKRVVTRNKYDGSYYSKCSTIYYEIEGLYGILYLSLFFISA